MEEADYENMSAFSCGVKLLDDFFHFEVKDCVNHRYLAAYCAKTRNNKIVAAFTLMNDALMIPGIDDKSELIDDLRIEEPQREEMVDFLKKQTSYPAINIGHLGVDCAYQRKGIGETIIDFIVATFAEMHHAGCQFVTVDAINNPDTIRFYQRVNFIFQTNRDFYESTRRMYRLLPFGTF